MNISINLKNKVALVVGGSRGIGGAISKTLALAGANVTFTHTGNPKYETRMADLLNEIRTGGGQISDKVMDARDSTATAELANDLVRQNGRLDILVYNVGENIARKAADLTDEQWQDCIELNLSAAFYSVRAALPHMCNQKYGRIILIGSSAVHNGGGGAIDYAAAKSGLTGMMMYLCKEYTRKGILTNIIHPCLINTDLLKNRYSKPEDIEMLTSQVPAGRLGKPEDIAYMTAFLASSFGDFICGQSILVDGGRTLFR